MLKTAAAEKWEAEAAEEREARTTEERETEAAKAIETSEAAKATEATEAVEAAEATEATAHVACGSSCCMSRNAGMSALGKGASSKERQAQNQAQDGSSSDFTHVCH